MFHLNASHLEEYQTKQYILRLEVCGREEGGKFTFRISHDEFRMSLERSNCGYSFKITLSFLYEIYYTEAAKIIKKPLAALPPNIQSSHKRELHIQRHLPWMLSLLKDVCWLSWSSNFDESLFFSVIEA